MTENQKVFVKKEKIHWKDLVFVWLMLAWALIHFAVFCLRYIVHIQSGHLEHFTGTFTVTAGDQRSMHIDKSSLHEEGVDLSLIHI